MIRKSVLICAALLVAMTGPALAAPTATEAIGRVEIRDSADDVNHKLLQNDTTAGAAAMTTLPDDTPMAVDTVQAGFNDDTTMFAAQMRADFTRADTEAIAFGATTVNDAIGDNTSTLVDQRTSAG